MGRNAYINFYVWYYNEHRGQAPVTTIAKRAGTTWRKMTPQEKDRFMDRNFYPKGKMPLHTIKKQKIQNISSKAMYKRIIKSKNDPHAEKRMKHKPERKVRNTKKETKEAELKAKESPDESRERGKEERTKDKDTKGEEEEEEEESDEIIARRKNIQKWMDENHYS